MLKITEKPFSFAKLLIFFSVILTPSLSAFLLNTYGYYSPNSYNIWGVPNFRDETANVIQNIGTVDLDENISKEI